MDSVWPSVLLAPMEASVQECVTLVPLAAILAQLMRTALLVHLVSSSMMASVSMTAPKPLSYLLMPTATVVVCHAKVPVSPALTKLPVSAAFPITSSMEQSVNRHAILVITLSHALSHTRVKSKAIISPILRSATPVMPHAPSAPLRLMLAKHAISLTFSTAPAASPHAQLELS